MEELTGIGQFSRSDIRGSALLDFFSRINPTRPILISRDRGHYFHAGCGRPAWHRKMIAARCADGANPFQKQER